MDCKDKIIILIRHGEKIFDDYTDLSITGIARAECLPKLFSSTGIKYIPTKLYANNRSKKSTRPYDTLIPLSKALNLEIEEFKKSNVQEVIDFVENKLTKDEHNVILISSSHKVIPYLSTLLGHEVDASKGNDKFFIWKNGKFLIEGKQSDYIGKDIDEWLKNHKK